MWDCKDIGVKESVERDGGWIRVKRIETVLKGSLMDLSHILAS